MSAIIGRCPDCNRRGEIDGVECCRCAGTGHIGHIGEPWLALHAENCPACGGPDSGRNDPTRSSTPETLSAARFQITAARSPRVAR